jgi:toxin-antitoxin system PIN domain toxin
VSRFLLDVNVVIALVDPLHVHHERAHRWFASRSGTTWCTSPVVQNGALRILAHPKYPNPQSMPAVVMSLTSLVAHPEHEFLADSVSLLTGDVRRERLLSSAQVTDSYLLALAVASDARLVTFDTKLVTLAVPGGTDALLALT